MPDTSSRERVAAQLFAAKGVVNAARAAQQQRHRIEPTRLRLAVKLLEQTMIDEDPES